MLRAEENLARRAATRKGAVLFSGDVSPPRVAAGSSSYYDNFSPFFFYTVVLLVVVREMVRCSVLTG